MRQVTIILNRQVIRLCKGVLKAWEQWVDAVEGDDEEAVRLKKTQKETFSKQTPLFQKKDAQEIFPTKETQERKPYDKTINS